MKLRKIRDRSSQCRGSGWTELGLFMNLKRPSCLERVAKEGVVRDAGVQGQVLPDL